LTLIDNNLTEVDIGPIESTKKNYEIFCKICDWHIAYLHTTYWKMERTMDMIASMPKVPGGCSHELAIKELFK